MLLSNLAARTCHDAKLGPLLAAWQKRFRCDSLRYPTYLSEDVSGIGRKGEIVLLKAGTARNVVRHMKHGHMLPKDYFRFDNFRHVFETIGIPLDTAQKYYDGKIIPRIVGTMKTDAMSPKLVARKYSALDLLCIKTRFANDMKKKYRYLRMNMQPAKPDSPNFVMPPLEKMISGDIENLGLATGIQDEITGKDFVDKLHELGVENAHICLPSGIGVNFKCCETGSTLKSITKTGKYKAYMHMNMITRFPIKLKVSIVEKTNIKSAEESTADSNIVNPHLDLLVTDKDSSVPDPSPSGVKLLARHRLQRKREWYLRFR